MSREKEEYAVETAPQYEATAHYGDGNHIDSKDSRIREAQDLYGSAAEAEHYGYVARG
jgi:hypothetical protein